MVPEPEAAGAALDDARARARLVILTADLALHISPAVLEAALLDETPTLAIIPDMLLHTPLPDLAKRLRSALGIET